MFKKLSRADLIIFFFFFFGCCYCHAGTALTRQIYQNQES